MAINVNDESPRMLEGGLARIGATLWIVLWLAVLAGNIVLSLLWKPAQAAPWAQEVLHALAGGYWLALLALTLAALLVGFFLFQKQVWAQPVLLVTSCLGLVIWIAYIFGVLLEGGLGKAFTSLTPERAIVMGAVLVVLGVLVGLFWSMSAAGSRLRYASNVILTGAVALALFVVVNLIAQGPGNSYRRDFQSIGQYGLSERSKKILRGIDEPIKITSLYSTSEANSGQPERASRVWELLTQMHDFNPRIEVARATTDAERADILARVAAQQRQRCAPYAKLLETYQSAGSRLVEQLRAYQTQWKQLAGNSYLDQWGAAAQLQEAFKALVQEQEDLTTRLPRELSGLPDYAKLTDEVKGICTRGKESLAEVESTLKMLAGIPTAVTANRAATSAALDAVNAAVRDALKTLGGATTASAPAATTGPADPTATLKRFSTAMQKAADKAVAAAQALDEVAGPENARFVRGSSAWLIASDEEPMVIGGVAMVPRTNLTRAFLGLSETLTRQKTIVDGALQAGTKDYQAKMVESMRTALTNSAENISQLTLDAKKAVVALGSVDEPTSKVFKLIADGKYMQPQVAEYAHLANDANNLPALPLSTLAADLTDENSILVETADKTEAVRFDQVWPVQSKPMGPMAADSGEKRVFNGDSAINSKVLAMTQKPLATVIIAYMELPPQMQQMMGGEGGVNPRMFEEMQGRLRAANFRVKTWDMATYAAPPDVNDPNEPNLQKVLLVLPPPDMPPMMARQPSPGLFGPQTVALLRRAIDSGEVSAAIFLAQWQPPMSPYAPPARYGWNDYLVPDWGVEARTRYVVLPAERDEDNPQRFQLAVSRVGYLPLSTFSDHPIGKPLQGQRVFWQVPCPVSILEKHPAGVSAQALLTVPTNWTSTWATNDVERVTRQIEEGGSYITPDYEHGDLRPPFDVAVAAARAAEPNQALSPARIVVLGMGASFLDSYVGRPVRVLKGKNVIATEDPPRGDLDVIVNSAYWLCGRDEYIAAGPVQVQPIRVIQERTYNVLRAVFVIGLPLLLLGVGGLVLLLRRR